MAGVLNGLNPAQKAAVTSPSNVVQILAPPGSGKTKTLTARVAYLISHNGLLPRNIVVCTFTVKAAKEMKERLCGLLDVEVSAKLILGTFHSVARRYLCAYGDRIGLDPKFGIADSSDTVAVLRRITKKHQSSLEASVVRSRISKQKSQRISPDQYALLHRNLPNKEQQVEQQEFVGIWNEYEDHLRASNLLDYDDLLVRCVELLSQHPRCVGNIEAVLVDEFQDTNSVQFELMCLLASSRHAITTVGDPDQSIYGWRSAEIGNLRKMRTIYADTHVAVLEENYRSSGAILSTAQEVIEQDESRPGKSLLPTHSIGLPPVLRKLDNAKKEADWVVAEIRRLLDLTAGVLQYNDFVILLRSASLSRLIEASLGRRAIPYRTVGGHRFFDRVEVKLILDYLRVISNPDHDDALARVLNVPTRRIGDVTIDKLLTKADALKKPLWYVVKGVAQDTLKSFSVSDQATKGLQMFVDIIVKCRSRLQRPPEGSLSLSDFLGFVLAKAKIEQHLRSTQPEEFDARWANIEELIAQADEITAQISKELALNQKELDVKQGATDLSDDTDNFEDIHDSETSELRTPEGALACFLANIALSTEVQKAADEEAQQTGGQITISTIHAAKGLEWPIVFVPAVCEGTIPHSRAEDNDEERRLLYVAMTRAQALLYLSCPIKDSRNNSTEMSSFLTPKAMIPHFVDRGSRIGYEAVKEIATILRRTSPTSTEVEVARMRAEEVNDTFRVPGEEDEMPDLVAIEEDRGYQGYASKRRRMDGRPVGERSTSLQAGSMTLMNNDAYSVSNTTIKPAFTTASKVPLQMNDSSKNIAGAPSLKQVGAPRSTLKRSQSNLASWISGKSTVDKENGAERLPVVRSIATEQRIVDRKKTPLPTGQHSLDQSAAGTSYTHVSSTLFHQTSVDIVQQKAVGSGLVRRGYGAKPSMNGWQARMAREKR